MTSSTTVIVGAGLAGLSAAIKRAEAGESVTLLEASPIIGGMAISVKRDDVIFDLGPHFIADRTVPYLQYFKPEEFVEFKSRIHFVINGKWIEPFGFTSIKDLPLPIFWDFLKTRFGLAKPKDYPANSLAARFSDMYGDKVFRYVLEPYLSGKFGMSPFCEVVHANWGSEIDHDRGKIQTDVQVVEPPKVGLGERIAYVYNLIKYLCVGNRMLYPRAGFGEVPIRMADHARRVGVKILTECPVTEIKFAGSLVTAVVAGGQEFPLDHLVWTGDVIHLTKLLGKECKLFQTYGVAIYFATIEGRHPRHGTEVRPVSPKEAFYRAYYPDVICSELAPPNRSAIAAEVGFATNEELARADEKYDELIESLVRLKIAPDKKSVRHVSHIAIPNSYPIYPLDYLEQLEPIYQSIEKFQNIIIAGRRGRASYIDSNVAVRQGIRAGENKLF